MRILLPLENVYAMRLFAVLVVGSVSAIDVGKELVFFAGPHSSAATSIEVFFHRHVSNFKHMKNSLSLPGWKWPTIDGNLLPADEMHKVFGLLVTNTDDETVQQQLDYGIRKAWKSAEVGVIIGTEEFDHVGKTPDTHYNALAAMEHVVTHVQAPSNRVTVILNYRSPRFDQWASIFQHSGKEHYHKFLCGSKRRDHIWEVLDTAMNPLRLAAEFRAKFWNVVLIDMDGVAQMERDVVNVLACDVLKNSTCKDGWMTDRYMDTSYETTEDHGIHSLSVDDAIHLEMIFRERDCFYKSSLENDSQFRVLYKDTLWKGCLDDEASRAKYELLADSDYMLEVIRTQKGCAEDRVPMEQALVGDFEATTSSSIANELRQGRKSNGSTLLVVIGLLVVGGAATYRRMARRKHRNVDIQPQFEMESIGQHPFSDEPDEAGEDTGDYI